MLRIVLILTVVVSELAGRGTAHADVQEAVARIRCAAAADTLVIAYQLLPPEKIRELMRTDGERTVHFWSLVEYSRRADGDPDRVTGVRDVSRTCRLSDGVYEVVLRPGIPNLNLQGRCGAAITGQVKVLHAGKSILSETAFENLDCARRDSSISEVSISGKTGQVRIKRASP